MVTCEICGRQFKNTQGLRGHKTFVHGYSSPSSTSVTPAAAEEQLSKLEDRLEKLEYITGLRKVSILDRQLNTEKPLTEKLNEFTQQLNSLAYQLASLSSNTASDNDMERISERITQLTQQLSSYSKWFKPVKTVAGTMSHHENELSNRAENTRVNALENRIVYLEEEQQEGERKIIGINTFVLDKKTSIPIFEGDPEGEAKQIKRLNRIRVKRGETGVIRCLDNLSKTAESKTKGEALNIVPAILEAVRADATEGEIFSALRKVYGEYMPPTVF